MRCRWIALAFALPSWGLVASAEATEAALLTVKLRIRVARCPGAAGSGKPVLAPIKPRSWIVEHVEAARRVLEPYRVRLVVEQDAFTPARCALLDRSQRDAMARHAPQQREVVVLVMQRIRDLDLPSYNLMGVHWRYGGSRKQWRGRRWLFLTARARPPVLAHELAHYFGLRHDPRGGNLMTPGPSDPRWRRPGNKPRPFEPRLTAAQARRLRRAVQRFSRGVDAAGSRRGKSAAP